MKKLLLVVPVALLAISIAAGSAFTLSLEPYFGPIKVKISNWEMVVPSFELSDDIEDNWGVYKVTSIEDLEANTLWYPGKSGEYLTGMFYNMDIIGIVPLGPLTTRVNMGNTAITGTMDLYLDDFDLPGYTAATPALGPGLRSGLATYPGFTDSNVFGGPALSMTFVPGIFPGVTMTNIIDAAGPIGTGVGDGYAAIVPGSGPLAFLFDSNTFLGGTADVGLKIDYDFPGDFGWTINSDDPISGNIVPEPASMLLFGMGLFGIAGLRLRRRKVA
jgi:hypothetical protein